MDEAIMKRKKQLVSEMYIQLLEMMGDTPFDVVKRPDNLFNGDELDAIPDIRRRLFYSLFSHYCVFVEVSEFNFTMKRSCILFCIMLRQLELYAPETDEYLEASLAFRSVPPKWRVSWM